MKEGIERWALLIIGAMVVAATFGALASLFAEAIMASWWGIYGR